jgi:protein SCO1/2
MARAPFILLTLLSTFTLACVCSGCSLSGSGAASSSASTPASAQTPGASGLDGAALPRSVPPPENFTLNELAGPPRAPVSLSSYRGRVLIIAFVYSTCGATCVVIAQQIRGALDELRRPVPVLFVSANPTADTPARVRRFLAQVSLTGRVHYLSGPLARLRPIWRAFRIVPATVGRAAFERSASVLVLDRTGRERVIFQLEQLTPEGLAHDVRKLEAES